MISLNKLVAVVSILVVAVHVSATEPNVEEEPWVPIFHKVYDTNKDTATLDALTTLKLLGELEHQLAQEKYLVVENMSFALDRVRALIDVSHLHEAKCSKEAFEDLAEVIAPHENTYWNILTYLRHFRAQQLVLCGPKIDSLLVAADDKFSEEEQVELNDLVSKIDEAKRANSNDRIDGLIGFIEKHLGTPISDYKNNKEKFVDAYERSAKKICQKVADELREPLGIYNTLVDEPEAFENFNKLTSVWIHNGQVCDKLMTTMDYLIKSPSRLLVSIINKPRKRSP